MTEVSTMKKQKTWDILLWILIAIVVILNLIRLFPDNFWSDEIWSLKMLKLSFGEMLDKTAGDVHPPLFYIVLRFFVRIFGYHPWVYRLAAYVPYLGILIIIATFIRNKFGSKAAVLLVILVSLLENSLTYIIEVRMYELPALGFFAAFCAFYCLLEEETVKGYVIFAISSLVTVYSQYIMVLAAAPLYIALLCYTVIKKRKIRNIVILYFCTVAAYLPWIFRALVFVRAVGKGGFWLRSNPELKWILVYFFNTGHYYAAFMLLVSAIVFLLTLVRHEDEGQWLTVRKFWIIAGVIATFFPVAGLEVVSLITGPCIIPRYFYPSSMLLFIMLAVAASWLKRSDIVIGGLCILSLVVCCPHYYSVYKDEQVRAAKNIEAQALMKELFTEGDVTVTNNAQFRSVMGYYMPEFECHPVTDSDFRPYSIDYDLDADTKYWALWRTPIDSVDEEWLDAQGFSYKSVLTDSCFGDTDLYLYELEHY